MSTDTAMLATKAIAQGAEPQPKPDNQVIRKLFLMLHGSYGNLFTSKFATGEHDSRGKDKGILAAMLVWEFALSKFPPDVIETAVTRLSTESPDFPPNLPRFESICRACMPRKTYAEEDEAYAEELKKLSEWRDCGRNWVEHVIRSDGAQVERKSLPLSHIEPACIDAARDGDGFQVPGVVPENQPRRTPHERHV